jgi:hypothetical protein
LRRQYCRIDDGEPSIDGLAREAGAPAVKKGKKQFWLMSPAWTARGQRVYK